MDLYGTLVFKSLNGGDFKQMTMQQYVTIVIHISLIFSQFSAQKNAIHLWMPEW